MTDNEWFAELYKQHTRDRALRLAKAKQAARERGKEPFDLAKVEAIYARFSPPWNASDEEKIREWEYSYFVSHERALTLKEFAQAAWLTDVYDGGDMHLPGG